MIKESAISFLLCLIFLQCISVFQKEHYVHISCDEAMSLIEVSENDTNFVVIDFRSDKYFNRFHLPGAIQPARVRIQWTVGWKTKRYLIYCQGGFNRKTVFKQMEEMGFKKVTICIGELMGATNINLANKRVGGNEPW